MPWHSQQTLMVATLQDWSPPGGEALARLLSHLGGEYFYLLLIPCLLWFAPWPAAVKAARVMVLADLAGEWVKWTLNWPRPALALAQETSPGFVSTHAAISLAVALVLGADKPRWRPWLGLWVLGVGWSRLRLGVHFPLDILGGWLLALVLAALVLRLGQDSRRASYLVVGLAAVLTLLWPEGGVESLHRDLGMLLGLEVSLLQRHRGGQAVAPPPLFPAAGALRLALMLACYVGLKALHWPRLLRYLVLALLAGWRRAFPKEFP